MTERDRLIGMGLTLGAGLGLLAGAAFGNPGVGLVLGSAVGLARHARARAREPPDPPVRAAGGPRRVGGRGHPRLVASRRSARP
jgi:hypothetical protein